MVYTELAVSLARKIGYDCDDDDKDDGSDDSSGDVIIYKCE